MKMRKSEISSSHVANLARVVPKQSATHTNTYYRERERDSVGFIVRKSAHRGPEPMIQDSSDEVDDLLELKT